MKKLVLLLLISLVLPILFSINVINVTADETNPCTIYGTVKDENGIVVEGTIIIVENINSKEKNSVGNDTIIGNPITVKTDSNGIYTFELINLKSGYSDGDEIIVTAEKDGIIGSKSIIVGEGSWGVRADITLGIEENQEKESWYGSLSNIWILLIIVFVVVLILILTMFRRRKPKEISPSCMETKKRLPPPPSGYKSRKEILSPKKEKRSPLTEDELPKEELPPPEDEISEDELPPPEDEIPEDELPPPEDEIPEDELPPPEDEISEDELPPPEDEIPEDELPPPEDEILEEEVEVFECPNCDSEVAETDIKCPGCDVEFGDFDEIPEDELPPPEDEIIEEELPPTEDETSERDSKPPEIDRQKLFGNLSRIGILYIISVEIIVIIIRFFIKNNIEVL